MNYQVPSVSGPIGNHLLPWLPVAMFISILPLVFVPMNL